MKIFSAKQTREIDKYSIENEPVTSVDLMERAAGKCSAWISAHYGRSHSIKFFCGSGNNGGDGLAMARQLEMNDYDVEVFILYIGSQISADNSLNLDLLRKNDTISVYEINSEDDFPVIQETDIIVDAVYGSGLSRPISGLTALLIEYLNSKDAIKVSIDIPSGVPPEGVVGDNIAFKADYTLTFQFPFLSFFFSENEEYVGCFYIMDIQLHAKIINRLNSIYHLVEKNNIILRKRPRFAHKGTFGHALLITGSYEMAGAAILSTKACLKSGCGLVTTHIPGSISGSFNFGIPEAILSIDANPHFVTNLTINDKYSAIAIGPGLGNKTETCIFLKDILLSAKKVLVIDADALNIISQNKDYLQLIPQGSILTPHPGEFERLFGKSGNSFERLILQRQMAINYGLIIVLKGKYTCIATPNGICYLNPTGNSGMATAGSGDVLTGIIVSLLAQGYSNEQAALFGVYIHGLAGDLAAEEIGEESLIASDIISYLGKAFKKIKLQQYEQV